MLRMTRLSNRREETLNSRERPEEALLLPIPSTTTMNAVKVVPIGANLMVMGKTSIYLEPMF
jgi:hypothetical protein